MSIQYGGDKVTFSDGSTLASGNLGFKNRIINGAMTIDQRNAGASASFANTGAYCLDRWRVSNGTSTCTVQRSTNAPAGFTNSLLWTVSTTDNTASQSHALQAKIEGNNVADLAFGTASAKTITLSFWVKSSLAGTYGVGFSNDASDRSYVATYTINAANTWEYKTITLTGDTAGTWLTNTSVGLEVVFDLGSGSSFNGSAGSWGAGYYRRTSGCVNLANTASATWQLTGVQLEVGASATSFETRAYGTELALCQRYYQQYDASESGAAGAGLIGVCGSSNVAVVSGLLPVTMRTTATVGFNNLTINYGGATVPVSSIATYSAQKSVGMDVTTSSASLTIGRAAVMQFSGGQSAANRITFSAEL